MSARLLITSALLAFSWAGLAKADQIFTTAAGSTSGGEAVSASADFSITGTTLTLKLTDLQTDFQDAGQLLTDIFFTLTEPGTPTLSSETGPLVRVTEDKKTKVQTVTNLPTATLGWAFGGITLGSLNGFELCTICQGGLSTATTPSEGIIGPPSADGLFDNANGSIAENPKNPSHNPFVNQTATFIFTGLPAGAVIGDVSFSFSTTPGANVAGVPSSVIPEPGSVLLMGTALLLLARFEIRRTSRKGRLN